MSARNECSRGASSGASSRRRTVREPRRSPTICSSRYSARPGDEPWIHGLVEPEHLLRHAARRRDQDDHDARRLEREHLDVPDRRGLERRRGDEREEARRVGEHVGRRPERLLDLVAHRAKLDAEGVRATLERVDELLRVDAVAALRRRPARRGVRMGQQAERLELCELTAHGGSGEAETGALDEHARTDRLAGRNVLLDHPPQDLAFPRCQLHPNPMVTGATAVAPFSFCCNGTRMCAIRPWGRTGEGGTGEEGEPPRRPRRVRPDRRALRAASCRRSSYCRRSSSTSATCTCTSGTTRRWSTREHCAGGTKFVGCSFQFGDPAAANEAIKATALQYAGDTLRESGHLQPPGAEARRRTRRPEQRPLLERGRPGGRPRFRRHARPRREPRDARRSLQHEDPRREGDRRRRPAAHRAHPDSPRRQEQGPGRDPPGGRAGGDAPVGGTRGRSRRGRRAVRERGLGRRPGRAATHEAGRPEPPVPRVGDVASWRSLWRLEGRPRDREHRRHRPRVEDRQHAVGRRDVGGVSAPSRPGSSSATPEAGTRTG